MSRSSELALKMREREIMENPEVADDYYWFQLWDSDASGSNGCANVLGILTKYNERLVKLKGERSSLKKEDHKQELKKIKK